MEEITDACEQQITYAQQVVDGLGEIKAVTESNSSIAQNSAATDIFYFQMGWEDYVPDEFMDGKTRKSLNFMREARGCDFGTHWLFACVKNSEEDIIRPDRSLFEE